MRIKLLFLFIFCINISFASVYVVVGDTGNTGHSEEEVAALVKCINPDFVLNTGDVSYKGVGSGGCKGGSNYDVTVGADDMYGSFYPSKFYPTIGNHDYCDSGSQSYGGENYIEYFSSLYTDGKKYYEKQIGDIHLFSLDYKRSHTEQKEWLQEKASASSASHKVVFFHTAPYHVGTRSRDRNMEFDKWSFKELGISAVYVGHEHTYQRFLVDNIPYFVNGAGGNYDGELSSSTSSGGQNVLATHKNSHGALVVNMNGASITWEFVGTDGIVKDSFPSASGRDYSNCKQDDDTGVTNIIGSASYTPTVISGSSSGSSSRSYPTCDYCSLLDDAWNNIGGSQVYVPTVGLAAYTSVYPPATVSSPVSYNSVSSSSSSSSSSSGSASGTCVANLGDTDDDYLKAALLDMTAWAEVGTRGGYDTIFGGGTRDCTNGHPQEVVSKGGYRSSAYGRYQFLTETAQTYGGSNWETYFCAREQDVAAWRLVEEKRKVTLSEVRSAYNSGDLTSVLDRLAGEWASFPYSKSGCSSKHCGSDCRHNTNGNQCGSGKSYYGQGGKSQSEMFQVFDQCYKIHSGQIKRALVIGDSQVGGNGGIEIEKMLEEEGYYVDRVGCVGATTTHLLNGGKSCSQGSDEMQSRDRDYTLKSYDSYYDNHDLVILMAGGNEYKGGQVNAALYAKLQSAEKCIVVGLVPLGRSDSTMVGAYYISQEEHKGKCSFVDIEENVLVEGTHNSVGDPHLNGAGGEVIADLIDDMIGIYS